MFGLDTVLANPVSDYSPARLAWTAAALAWLCAVPMYVVSKFVDTVAHEGGHAIVARLLFQKVTKIRFGADGGGETGFGAKMPRLFDIFVTLAGHLGPSMFGLLAVALLVRGATEAVLWISIAFLLLMLLVVRGWIGLVIVPALMVAIGAVAVLTEPPWQVLLTHMWAWFLLIAPVQSMLHHIGNKVYTDPRADTAVMKRLTLIPGEVWAFVLLAGTIAALAYGGGLLLHQAG